MTKSIKPWAVAAGAVIVAVAGWSQAQQGTGAQGTSPGGSSDTNPVQTQEPGGMQNPSSTTPSTPGTTPSTGGSQGTTDPNAAPATPGTTSPGSTTSPGTTGTPADGTTAPSDNTGGNNTGTMGARADRN